MFAVVVARDGALTWRKTFATREIRIGRADGNDLMLRDSVVSRRHARIVRRDGKYIVVDLKSTRGTQWKGKPLISPAVVREGEPIGIGPYELTIQTVTSAVVERAIPMPTADDTERALIAEIARGVDSARLVYADWLEERGDDVRAEYLRVQQAVIAMPPSDELFEETSGRLRELAAVTDAAWRLHVAHSTIEACPVAFDFKCPKRWSSLTPTSRLDVRHCDACHKDVHYATSAEDARAHAARGACVAFDISAARWQDDLAEPFGVTVCASCKSDYAGLDECPRCGPSLPRDDDEVGRIRMGMISMPPPPDRTP